MNFGFGFFEMDYLFIFGIVSFCGVYVYKNFAIKLSVVSKPNFRTLHEHPTPRGGGIVFSITFLVGMLLMWNEFKLSSNLFSILVVGGALAAIFGFIDDIKNIRARFKLIFQLFLAMWVVYWLYSEELKLLNLIPMFIAIPVCLFFMVWMLNAYNFMDGIDGMAASGAIFASLTLSLILFLTDSAINLFPIFVLLAVTVSGFFVFNWPPATIFMGDSGSVFLGYIFGSLLLYTTLNGLISFWSWVLVVGYFLSDTMVTQILRVVLVTKWYRAHRSHAYQNLARITKSHSKVTIGVAIYNVLWILPLAVWSVLKPEMGAALALISIIPAIFVSLKFGPLLSTS
jgi:Fuc2NAc and GlcNAc transferase